ncbi:MAG: aldolase, partial [Chloroflexi bacterium]|nr:aldolase [Chloroflexota bacterium]
ANDTDEQFIYKTRKKLWGPFKNRVWTLPESTRSAIRGQLEEKFAFLFEQLNAVDTRDLVAKHVANPTRIDKAQPESLKAVAA